MAQCVSECHASSHFKLSFIFISIYFCFLLQLCLHTKIQREKKKSTTHTKKKWKKKESKNFFTLAQTEISARRRLRLPFLLLFLLLSCATRCGKIFICFSFSLFIIPTSLKYFCLQRGARAVAVVAVVFMAVAVFSGVPSEMFDLYFICCRM